MFLGFMLAVSCIDIVEIDPRERIVSVHCILTNDSVQTVDLRYSSYVSESSYAMVEDASVKISCQVDTILVNDDGGVVFFDTVYTYDFVKVGSGKWQADFVPKENFEYKLEVTVPGEEVIFATTKFPGKVEVLDYNYLGEPYGASDPSITPLWSFGKIHTKSFIDSQSSDMILTYYPSVAYKVRGPIMLWIYGMEYNPNTFEYKVADYIYTNHLYLDKFNISDKTKNDLNFNQSNINVDVLRSWHGGREQWWYDHPEYWCYGNLPLQFWSLDWAEGSWTEERALFGTKEYPLTTLWPSDDYVFYHKYLRILHPETDKHVSVLKRRKESYDTAFLNRIDYDDALLERGESKYFTICVNFKEWKYLSPHPLSHLVFESVSAEYDRYLKDLVSYNLGTLQDIENSDLTHIWERVEVYTNITNGKGVFGASNKKRVLWGISGSYYEAYQLLGDDV